MCQPDHRHLSGQSRRSAQRKPPPAPQQHLPHIRVALASAHAQPGPCRCARSSGLTSDLVAASGVMITTLIQWRQLGQITAGSRPDRRRLAYCCRPNSPRHPAASPRRIAFKPDQARRPRSASAQHGIANLVSRPRLALALADPLGRAGSMGVAHRTPRRRG